MVPKHQPTMLRYTILPILLALSYPHAFPGPVGDCAGARSPGVLYTMTNGAAGNSEMVIRASSDGLLHLAEEVSTDGLGTTNPDLVFTFPLSDTQEVPPSGTGASGRAVVRLDTNTGRVDVNGSYHGLSSNQTLAHIHGPAPVGVNAGILVTLTGNGGTNGSFSGSGTLTPEQVADMEAGLHYINIHTMTFPSGEIRGQVVNGHPPGSLNGVPD